MKEHPILFSGSLVRALLAGTKTQTRRIIPEPKVARIHGRRSEPARHFADPGFGDGGYLHWAYTGGDLGDDVQLQRQMFRARVGERLYVRETWRAIERESDMVDGILFAADNAFVSIENTAEAADKWVEAYDNGKHGANWRPSIFMPRWASRITLEVTGVRVERLQDISEEDAKAEGVAPATIDFACECQSFEIEEPGPHTAACPWRNPSFGPDELAPHQLAFAHLWQSINGKRPGCSWEANPWVWVVSFRRIGP